ncbi:MAG: hypothetical protein Q9159_007370 [Coniocarpon cinnabarinum]
MASEADHAGRPDGDEDQDEEIDEQRYLSVKDAVLFAIDINNSMLKPLSNVDDSKKGKNDCAAIAALKCAYQLMQQRVISNPNDKMGILLFGTEKSRFVDEHGVNETGVQYPHCYLLMDVDRTGAADIKQVRSVVEDEEESRKLLVPTSEDVAMSNVLFCVNQIFTTRAQNFASRRLFLVTDNDSPQTNNKDMKSAAVVRAKDLYDLGVTIELFPIAQAGKDFDTSRFYDDIIYRPPSDPEAPAPIARATNQTSAKDGISLLQSLISSIHQKIVPKRALFANLPLEFSPDFKISVKGYTIFKRQTPKRSLNVWMDGEVPLVAEVKGAKPSEDSGKSMNKFEIRKAFKFGGEDILFTEDELKNINYFGEPVIRIIGFKPIDMLPPWANVKEWSFVYPSEEQFVGSTRTFSALQQTLLKKQRMALVWFIARRNASPVIAAMLPGAEKLGPSGEQILPPGMWLSRLPFVDDIRHNPMINVDIRAPDILKDKMRAVVQQLQLPRGEYDPSKYPNPALQWHYRVLQALALDEDMPEKPEDKTIPKNKQIDKRAGGYIEEWGNTLQAEFEKWQRENKAQATGGKRGTPSLTQSAPSKKTKAPQSGGDSLITDDAMKKHWKDNTINKLTLPQLKAWLKDKNMSVAGKKQELVERVEGVFEDKMNLD